MTQQRKRVRRMHVCFEKANKDVCLRVSPELKWKQHDSKLESQSRVGGVWIPECSCGALSLCFK